MCFEEACRHGVWCLCVECKPEVKEDAMSERFVVREDRNIYGNPRAYTVVDTWSGLELQRVMAYGGFNLPHLAQREVQDIVDQLNGAGE